MRLWMRTILLCGLVWAAGLGCAGGEPEAAKVAKTVQGEVVFPPPGFTRSATTRAKRSTCGILKGA